MSTPELEFEYREICQLGTAEIPCCKDNDLSVKSAWVFEFGIKHPETGNKFLYHTLAIECISNSRKFGIETDELFPVVEARDGSDLDSDAGDGFADFIVGVTEGDEGCRPFENVNLVLTTPARTSWLPKNKQSLAHLLRGDDPNKNMTDMAITLSLVGNKRGILELIKDILSDSNTD